MLSYARKFGLGLFAAALTGAPSPAGAQQTGADSLGGRFVTVMGARIYYIDRGKGPVVVLVHGLGDQATVWKRSFDALAESHRVVAVDLIGFGHSDKPPFDYRVDTFVDFLVGFLHALQIEHSTVVGNSLGGWIAAELAILHPQLVDALVLVDAGGFASPEKIPERVALALHLSTRDDYLYLSQYTFFDKKFYPDSAFLDYAMSERVKRGDGYTIAKIMESTLRNENVLDGRLGAIAAPTLLIWGRGDRLVPLATGERYKREIKGAKLVVLERCGHIPQVECPASLNSVLLSFLSEIGPKQ